MNRKAKVTHGNKLAPGLTSPDPNEARIPGIIESAMDGIISVDEQHRIVLFNPAAEKIFGYRASDLLGQSLDRLIPQRFRSSHGGHIRAFGASNVTCKKMGLESIYGLRANGEEFPIEASISQTEMTGRKLFTVILRDVTERNRTDAALRESEQRYRSLFENMIEGYAYCRILFEDGTPNDFIYLEVNSKFESITGLKNVNGKKVSEVIPGIREANPELIQTYGRVALTGKPERFETYVDSLGIWFDVAVYSPAKEHFVAVFDNITERIQTAEQMRLQVAALESAGNAVVITDEKGEIIWVNPAFTQSTGYSPEEVVGRNPRLLKSGKQDRAFYQEMWETILAGRVWRNTVINRRKDGALNHEDLTITPIRNSAGKITHFVGIKQDITEKTHAEEALQASEVRYRRLFESAKDGILILDAASGQIVDANPFLLEMLGYSKEELAGKELWEIGLFKDVLGSKAAFLELQQQGYIRYENLPLETRGGLVKQVEFVSNSYLAGETRVLQCNIRDITDRQQAEQERVQLTAEIESHRQRLNNIVASVPGVVWEAWGDPDAASQRIDFVSDYVETMLGYNVEEWLSTPNFWLTIVHPDDKEEAGRVAGEAFASGKSSPQEFRWMAKDGLAIWVESNYAVIKDEQGRSVGLRGVTTDITARKRAEEQLRNAKDFSENLIQTANVIILGLDTEGNIDIFNETAEKITGYTLSELKGRNWFETLVPKDRYPWVWEEFTRLISDGTPRPIENPILTKSGEERHIMWQNNQVWADGKVVATISFGNDITERKRAEEALHASERRYRDIFTFAPVGIYQSLRDGTLVTANQALAGMLGCDSVDELLEVNLARVYLNEDDRDRLIAGYEDRGYATDLELQWKRKDGTPIWIQLAAHAIKESDGLTEYFEGFVRDVTDRKRAVEALRESEERYRDLVENAHDIIYTHDLSGNYTSMSKAGEAITGYTVEEALKLNLSQTVAPEFVPKVREMLARKLAGERATAYEIEIIAKDGHRITIEANTKLVFQNGVPVGVQGIARDVTERKQLEEQLRQSQKMEAIGRLAGGVAHDFNNLLTAINGYSSLALQRIDDNHPLRNYLEEIKKAGERAANLTRQLLAFGRKQILQPLPINLNDVVTDMNKMLRRLIGEDVELTAKLDPALKRIKADPGQIEQVLVNLVVNARDAMPQGGNLTIETSTVDLDGEYAGRHVGVVPGRYVMLAVSDTGTGMDEKTKARIFDPFFTTKGQGKGTGLGLSTVYGIVKQSGGNIWVYSELGHGTTFKVYLPELAAAPQKTKIAALETSIPGGSETILLVEDEDVVRGLARKILERAGYNVLEANRGEEAVRLCLERAGPIDLLLTDVVMPETSGKEVADRLSKMLPGMRVLFMSGYTDEAIVYHGVLDSDVEFIQKPFTPAALAKKVREVLDSELVISDSVSLLPAGAGEAVGFEPSPDSLPEVKGEVEVEQEHYDA